MAELTRVKPICCVSLRFYAVFLGWEWSIDPAISDHADRPFRLCHAGSNACELTSDFNTDGMICTTPLHLRRVHEESQWLSITCMCYADKLGVYADKRLNL